MAPAPDPHWTRADGEPCACIPLVHPSSRLVLPPHPTATVDSSRCRKLELRAGRWRNTISVEAERLAAAAEMRRGTYVSKQFLFQSHLLAASWNDKAWSTKQLQDTAPRPQSRTRPLPLAASSNLNPSSRSRPPARTTPTLRASAGRPYHKDTHRHEPQEQSHGGARWSVPLKQSCRILLVTIIPIYTICVTGTTLIRVVRDEIRHIVYILGHSCRGRSSLSFEPILSSFVLLVKHVSGGLQVFRSRFRLLGSDTDSFPTPGWVYSD